MVFQVEKILQPEFQSQENRLVILKRCKKPINDQIIKSYLAEWIR
jgi:hypothetical protein